MRTVPFYSTLNLLCKAAWSSHSSNPLHHRVVNSIFLNESFSLHFKYSLGFIFLFCFWVVCLLFFLLLFFGWCFSVQFLFFLFSSSTVFLFSSWWPESLFRFIPLKSWFYTGEVFLRWELGEDANPFMQISNWKVDTVTVLQIHWINLHFVSCHFFGSCKSV